MSCSRAVAVLLGSLLLAGCASPNPSNPSPAANTPRPSPATTSTPVPSSIPTPTPTSQPGLAWTEIALDPVVFAGAQVGTVVAGGPGLVAFGRAGDTGAPLTWTSADGGRWTRHDQQPWTFGGAVPTSVATRPDGLVALGWGWGADQFTQEPWLSSDGISWTRSPSPARELGRGLDGITGTSGALVAFGAQREDGTSVLTSEDGRSWAPLPDPEGSLGPVAAVASVVPWHGGLLATGTIRAGAEGAVWTSADGRSWQLLPRQEALAEDDEGNGYFGGRLFGLSDGYVLVGVRNWGGVGAMAAWRSDDGVTWAIAFQEEFDFEGNVAPLDASLLGLRAVVALPEVNIGVVSTCDENGEACRESLAVSIDGLRWVPAATPSRVTEAGLLHRMVAVGSRVLLFGDTGPVRAWWGTPAGGAAASAPPASPSPLPSPSPSPAVSSAPPAASASDLAWHRLGAPRSLFGGSGGRANASDIVAVAPYADGVLAVGTTPWDIPGFGGYSPPFTTIAWRSPDGITWQRSPKQRALADGAAHGLAARGRLAVAVGSNGAESGGDESPVGISWRTTDGANWTRSPAQASLRCARMEDVVAADDGFVAVGAIYGFDTSCDMTATRPMVWASPDGLRWTRAATVEAEFDTANGWWNSGMRAVVRGGPGYVAVGWGQQHGVVWTSMDGQSWSIVPAGANEATTFGGGGDLEDVIAAPQGLVAVGSTGYNTPQGAVFASRDGIGWERVPVPTEIERSHLTSIATFAGGLVVGGGVSAGDAGAVRPILFTSPDGRTWIAADRAALVGTSDAPPAGEGQRMVQDVTARGDQIVAVGIDGERAAVWLGVRPDALYPNRTCPTGSANLALLDSMTPTDRVACFAGEPLRFRVYVEFHESDCCTYPVVLTRRGGAQAHLWFVTAAGQPPWKAGWNEVAGHFADVSCDAAAKPSAGAFPYAPPNQAVLSCREHFWVTKVGPVR